MATCLRCEYEWEPRKPEPKKCPRCQNPNWNRQTRRAKKPGSGAIETQRTAVVDKLYASSPTLEESNPPSPAEPECVRAPDEKDSLSAAKEKVDELMRRLTA